MIRELNGDLFDSRADIIGHGVNTHGVMGAGIAVAFKNRYPDMYERYKAICEQNLLVPGEVYFYVPESGPVVANIASQDKPGPNARYGWAMNAIGKVIDYAEHYNLNTIAIPRIGCGIGGLDWKSMRYELASRFHDRSVDIEVWSL